MRKMNNKTSVIVISVSIILLIVLIITAFDTRLLIRRYTVEAENISAPIRIVLVTDLHSC